MTAKSTTRKPPAKVTPRPRIVVPARKAPAKRTWQQAAEAYEFEEWYSSEDAKRGLTSICRAVNVQDTETRLLGAATKPLAVLLPASSVTKNQSHLNLDFDEMRSDWSALTTACLLFGTVIRLSGKVHEHAVLMRHPTNRHHALDYRRPQLEDIGQNLAMMIDDLREVSDKFSQTAGLIERRFKEAWRENNV